MPTHSPLGGVIRGLAAGAAGTAVMTASQAVYYKVMDVEPSDTPAQVGRKVLGWVGVEVPDEKMPALNNAMHWLYGTSWGVLLLPRIPRRSGLLFGLGVWGVGLVQLPAFGVAPPVWEYPKEAFPPDIGFHLVYGEAAALAFRALS